MSFLGAQEVVEGHPLTKNVIEIAPVHRDEARPFTVGVLEIGRKSIYCDEKPERIAALSSHFGGEDVTFAAPYWLIEPFRFNDVSIVIKGKCAVYLFIF